MEKFILFITQLIVCYPRRLLFIKDFFLFIKNDNIVDLFLILEVSEGELKF